MPYDSIEKLRKEVDRVNMEILKLLSERGKLVQEIGHIKATYSQDFFDPEREQEMLDILLECNQGPYPADSIKRVYKEIFSMSLEFMDREKQASLKVSRDFKAENTVVTLGDFEIGAGKAVIIAGPCAVETRSQVERTAEFLAGKGIKLLRGGAYKPRTSPYSFQGLEQEGLEILREAAAKRGMYVVTEVLDTEFVDLLVEHVDILQVGTRNMSNFRMLKKLGSIDKPVLLKRGFMSTMEEFLLAAEYIINEGNPNIILCERGIRTFERWTRNTLDISAVPLLKQISHLPVIVDLCHSAGRRDIMNPLGKASLAAGADGIMLEVHPAPHLALSDRKQQLTFEAFDTFLEDMRPFM